MSYLMALSPVPNSTAACVQACCTTTINQSKARMCMLMPW